MSDYQRIEKAIRFIEAHAVHQPSLEQVAAELDLSPYHCQRLFRRWVGVSPKRFLQYLTVDHAKRLLRESETSVLDATWEVGLSSPGRLHDHFVQLEAMTPGEYRARGAGLEIRHGRVETPFGEAVLASTDRGVCGLAFDTADDPEDPERWLAEQWPGARLRKAPREISQLAERVFEEGAAGMPVLVRGTNFQIQVWQALVAIPPGSLVSYSRVAEAMGRPDAVRAVASAVGANRISYLIPCHRVVRSAGTLGGYRWGLPRKRAMIAWESARQEAGRTPAGGLAAHAAG